MSAFLKLASGLIGSSTLTLIHQGAKRVIPHAPQVDAIGRRAVSRGVAALGGDPPRGRRLQNVALAGDLVSNAVYYAMINAGRARHRFARGAIVGMIGGLGAVFLPRPLGLGKQPNQRTPWTQLMTVAWYTLGGLAAAGAARMFGEREVDE